MNIKYLLSITVLLLPRLLFGQSEQAGFDAYVGLAVGSDQVITRNYMPNDTVDVSPLHKNVNPVIGINYTFDITQFFSLIIGASYTSLDYEFELNSIGIEYPDFPELNENYSGHQSGFFAYHVVGVDVGISKVIPIFKRMALVGSASLNYQFSKSNWTFEAFDFGLPDGQNQITTIFNAEASDNASAKHFFSPKLGLKVYPKLSRDKGSLYFFANAIWNNKYIHNTTAYTVHGLETENSGSMAQPLTHYTFGLGYRFKSK